MKLNIFGIFIITQLGQVNVKNVEGFIFRTNIFEHNKLYRPSSDLFVFFKIFQKHF